MRLARSFCSAKPRQMKQGSTSSGGFGAATNANRHGAHSLSMKLLLMLAGRASDGCGAFNANTKLILSRQKLSRCCHAPNLIRMYLPTPGIAALILGFLT